LATSERRLPKKDNIVPVFSSIVFLVFGWSILWFLRDLPMWLLYLSSWDILGLFAYAQAFALLESLFILLLIIILAALLPAKWFRLQFVAQGTTAIFAIAAWTTLFQLIFEELMIYWAPSQFFLWLGLALVSTIIAGILVRRSRRITRAVEALADRLTVFLYLYLPLGTIGLLVVMARNIL
jgi:hypothetical protein